MVKKQLNGAQPQSVEELAEKNGHVSETPLANLAKEIQTTNELAQSLMADANVPTETSSTSGATTSQVEQTKEEQAMAKRKGKRDFACISINLASGEAVTAIVKTYNPPFFPSNVAIQPESLDAINIVASDFLDTVGDASQQKLEDINQRQEVYFDLKPLARRIRSEVVASGATEKQVTNVSHFVDLLTGERILKVKPGAKTISAIHTTFGQQIQNLNGLIKVLKSIAVYKPNQLDLKTVALEQRREDMKVSNSDYYKAQATYTTSLGNRNKFFNAPITGYVDTYLAVKRSVRATYGSSSTEYNQIKGFKFRRIQE